MTTTHACALCGEPAMCSVSRCGAATHFCSEEHKAQWRARDAGRRPAYAHDCDACIFLGTGTVGGVDYDFYTCPRETLGVCCIARWGSDGPQYASMSCTPALWDSALTAWIQGRPRPSMQHPWMPELLACWRRLRETMRLVDPLADLRALEQRLAQPLPNTSEETWAMYALGLVAGVCTRLLQLPMPPQLHQELRALGDLALPPAINDRPPIDLLTQVRAQLRTLLNPSET